MPGQGSAENVLVAFASLVVPRLGQLLQGRLGMGIFMFGLVVFLWFFLLRLDHPPLVPKFRDTARFTPRS